MKDGGPAFPLNRTVGPTNGTIEDARAYGTSDEGMSLRDYFAGQIACNMFNGYESSIGPDGFHPAVYTTVAREAYRFADALLKERQQPPPA